MITRKSLVILLAISIAACTSAPQPKQSYHISAENKKTIDKTVTAVNKYNNLAVSPILYIENILCVQRHNTGKWPAINKPTNSNKLFDLYNVVENDSAYEAVLKPKHVNQYWRIHLSYSEKNNTASCPSKISVGETKDTKDFTLPFGTTVTSAKKSLSLPYLQFEKENIPIAMIIGLASSVKHHKNKPEPHSSQQINNPPLGEMIIAASICVLFNIDQYNCSLIPYSHKNNTDNKNLTPEERAREKLKSYFQSTARRAQ